MSTQGRRYLASTRQPVARAIVTVALPVVVFAGASDASAMSLAATHAPGGAVHTVIAQAHESQTTTISRSVGAIVDALR